MKIKQSLPEVLLVAGSVRNIPKTHISFCRLYTIVSEVVYHLLDMTDVRVREVVHEGYLVAQQRGWLWSDTPWRVSMCHALPHSLMCVCEQLRRQLHAQFLPLLELGHQMNR